MRQIAWSALAGLVIGMLVVVYKRSRRRRP
jgi:hypothetical protein